jgi:hypothetical protein
VLIALSALATIDVHGSRITAVDPVDGIWLFYDVDVSTGRVTEILKLPEAQSTILATRSGDGKRLFFHSGEPGTDGGIDMVDLATGTVTKVVAGGDSPDQERRLLFWSASGQTLFSLLCGAHECTVDVIDGLTGKAHKLAKKFGAIAASDHYALGYSSAEGPNRPWDLYDLSTDTTKVVAQEWIGETEEGIAIGADTFIVAGWSPDAATYNIVLVDGATGVERRVTSQSSKQAVLRLQPYLISEQWAAVSSDALWKSVLDGGAAISVIDINDGALLSAVGKVATH